MATKPVVQPEAWATNALYTTGPFIGSASKVVPAVGIAAEGHRPGANFPTAAEHENSQQNRLTALARWVFLGTFNTTANAHVVETNALGRAGVHGLTVADLIDETAVDITGANTLTPTILATCLTGATVFQSETGNTAGTGFAAQTKAGAATGFAAFMLGSPAGARGVRITADAATAGTCISATTAGTGFAGFFTSSGIPNQGAVVSVTCSGPSTTIGLSGLGSGNGAGLQGTGNGTSSANGVEGFLLNGTGAGVFGKTAPGATVASRGVKGQAQAAGDAIEAVVTVGSTGNALRLSAAPLTSTAIYVPGKAGDPSNTFNGRMDFNATTATWVHSDQDAANYRDFWSSRGGIAIGRSTGLQVVTNNSSVTWVVASTLTLTGQDAPHRAGVYINLRFTCDARTIIAALNTLDVRIRDTTAGVTVMDRSGVGAGATDGYKLATVTTEWQRGVAVDVDYLIPAAGDRTFVVEVKTATANGIQVRDPKLVPFGCVP